MLVYGAGSTTGQYLIQVLRLAGFKAIFVVASPRHRDYLRTLGATEAFDYRAPDVAQQILQAANGEPLRLVIDVIGAKPSFEVVSKVVGANSRVAVLLPIKAGDHEHTEGVVLTIPPWVSEQFPRGTELVPVAMLTFRKVRRVW